MVRAASSTELDYHKLPRRKLQQLCKKHGIPANKTNLFMADALTELLGKPAAQKSSPANEKLAEASPRSQIDESSQCTTEDDNKDEAGKNSTPVSSRPRKSVSERHGEHSEGRNSICTNVVMSETKEEQDDARSKARSLEPEREGVVGNKSLEESSVCVVSRLEVVDGSDGEEGERSLDLVEVKQIKVEASVRTSIIEAGVQEDRGPELEAKQAEVPEVPDEKAEPTAEAVLECPQEAVDGDRVQKPGPEPVVECSQEALESGMAKLPTEAAEHVKMEEDDEPDQQLTSPVKGEDELEVKTAKLQDSEKSLNERDPERGAPAGRGSEFVGDTVEVVEHEKAAIANQEAVATGCSADANLDNTVPELVKQPVEAADARETHEDGDINMEEAGVSNHELQLVTQPVGSCEVPDESTAEANMVKSTEKDVQMEEATKVFGPEEVVGASQTQGGNANRNEKQNAASFDGQLDLNADQAVVSEPGEFLAVAPEAVTCVELHDTPPHEDPDMKVEQLEQDLREGRMSIDADEHRQETTLISSQGAHAFESLCSKDQPQETGPLAIGESQPTRHSQAWKEMLERVVRSTRHRSSYKPAPFFKRTMLNRSLQKARSKRFEVITKQRMIQIEDASTASAPRPVFGRKRFIAKAMEEFSKRKQQEKHGSSQVEDSNSEQQHQEEPSDGMKGSLTPASAAKQAAVFPGGRIAMEQQKKRQEQFKTPIKGKSKEKAQDLAKKLGSAQRDSKLRALRGIEGPVC